MDAAHGLLERRYAGLRASGAAGWYRAEWIERSLAEWREVLGSTLGEPGRAVELGCGAGNVALALAAEGWSVAGLDVSPSAVAWARERAEAAGLAAEFEVADLGSPLPGRLFSPYDLVLDGDCLHYMIGGRREAFLANARALLAPGGTFAARTIVGEPAREEWAILGDDPETRTSSIEGVPMTYHAEAEQVLAELEAAGLAVEGVRMFEPEGARPRRVFGARCRH